MDKELWKEHCELRKCESLGTERRQPGGSLQIIPNANRSYDLDPELKRLSARRSLLSQPKS